MRETHIGASEDGMQLIGCLVRILPNAGKSFLYKMLRKKNILLNNKKAEGCEKLHKGDSIQVYFSDETYEKFAGAGVNSSVSSSLKSINKSNNKANNKSNIKSNNKSNNKLTSNDKGSELGKWNSLVKVIYEDENILIADKPVGLLSQKAKPDDVSLNDWLLDYLKITSESIFRPSVCNRLDRNTSGMVLCSKSIKGAQYLSEILRDRSLHKYYITLVHGNMDSVLDKEAYLSKDSRNNIVTVKELKADGSNPLSKKVDDCTLISTKAIPLKYNAALNVTMVKVLLRTGKSHQIRAHLANLGYPLVGDAKYGDMDRNRTFRDRFGVRNQLLHASILEFPKDDSEYSERVFISPQPEIYLSIMEAM